MIALNLLLAASLLTPASAASREDLGDLPRGVLWIPREDSLDWDAFGRFLEWNDGARVSVAVSPASLPESRREQLLDLAEDGRVEWVLRLEGDPVLPLLQDLGRALPVPAGRPGGAGVRTEGPSRTEDVAFALANARQAYKTYFGHYPKGLAPAGGAFGPDLLPLVRSLGFEWVAVGDYTSPPPPEPEKEETPAQTADLDFPPGERTAGVEPGPEDRPAPLLLDRPVELDEPAPPRPPEPPPLPPGALPADWLEASGIVFAPMHAMQEWDGEPSPLPEDPRRPIVLDESVGLVSTGTLAAFLETRSRFVFWSRPKWSTIGDLLEARRPTPGPKPETSARGSQPEAPTAEVAQRLPPPSVLNEDGRRREPPDTAWGEGPAAGIAEPAPALWKLEDAPPWTAGLSPWTSEPLQKSAWAALADAARTLERYRNSGRARMRVLNRAAAKLRKAESGRLILELGGLRGEGARVWARRTFRKSLTSMYRTLGVGMPEALQRDFTVGSTTSPEREPAPFFVSGADRFALNDPTGDAAAPEGRKNADPWDLTAFRVAWTESKIVFTFAFHGVSLDAPAPMVDVYIDLNHRVGSGASTFLPGRIGFLRPRDAWEYALSATPTRATLFKPNRRGAAESIAAPIPKRDLMANTLVVQIPRSRMRGRPSNWGFLVVSGAADETAAAEDLPRPLRTAAGTTALDLIEPDPSEPDANRLMGAVRPSMLQSAP